MKVLKISVLRKNNMNKLEQAWDYFINVFLGVDCEEEMDIMASTDPAMKELKESLQRVSQMESRLLQSTGSSTNVEIDYQTIEKATERVKQRKSGRNLTNGVVTKVEIDYKAVEKATERAKQHNKVEKSSDEIEIE